MTDIQDKILGGWLGLAIGEAMGSAVRSMKPNTIRQCFKSMDGYKEVRPFIGKGVKSYRMRGLYGAQTQAALVLCDHLLTRRKVERGAFISSLLELRQAGPDLYYGVYRRPEACFRRALELVSENPELGPPDLGLATATFFTLGAVSALYHRGRNKAIFQNSLSACLTVSRKFQELAGAVVMARLVDSLLKISPGLPGSLMRDSVLENAVQFAREAETDLLQILPAICADIPRKTVEGLSSAFELLTRKEMDTETTLLSLAENARRWLDLPIAHSSQGTALTLPQTALFLLANGSSFKETLTSALHLGGEADKLGAIVGALAGAYYGSKTIPEAWVSGLVNIREIKMRGEALVKRRSSSKCKPLFEMESALTRKEAEERAKFLVNEPKRKLRGSTKPDVFDGEEGIFFPEKGDRKSRRSFEREKSRKKRDRRRNLEF